MESLHLLFQRVEDAGMFKGIKLGSSVSISHMFYADDAVFVGQWCESNINTLVHVTQPSLAFSFRRSPRGGVEQEQFEELVTLVHDVRLVPMSDRWTWTLANSGEFFVASVNVLAWNVKSDSLPTRFNVSRRGIPIDSIKCGICDTGAETSSHLFFSCCMVRQMVRLISWWWDISYAEFESYEDWLAWLVNLRLPSKNKLMLEGVFLRDVVVPVVVP
ncbi:RNA-directed DNA polymerase, eukaryota [Tanacetum coccineum]